MDHMIVLFLVLYGNFILISILAVPIYIPTNNVGEFPFFHTLETMNLRIGLYPMCWDLNLPKTLIETGPHGVLIRITQLVSG